MMVHPGGRPPKDEAEKRKRYEISLTAAEREEIKAAKENSSEAELSLGRWIVVKLLEFIRSPRQ